MFKCQCVLQSVSSLAIWTVSGISARGVHESERGFNELVKVDTRIKWVREDSN